MGFTFVKETEKNPQDEYKIILWIHEVAKYKTMYFMLNQSNMVFPVNVK